MNPNGHDDSNFSGLPATFLRPEKSGALAAAVDWGLLRCESDAARALLPPLAALLSPFNATILPVHHPEGTGPAVDFRITLSRPMAGGRADRLRFAVLSETLTPSEVPIESHLTILIVDALDCLERSWQTAGDLVGQMLSLLVGNAEERGASD